MLKGLLKLALAAFIANAVWRVGSEYVAKFKFEDAVREAAVYGERGDFDLRQHIEALGAQFDLPIEGDAVSIERQDGHVHVEGSYEKPIGLIPGYPSSWSFPWHVDADLVRPKPGVREPTGDTDER